MNCISVSCKLICSSSYILEAGLRLDTDFGLGSVKVVSSAQKIAEVSLTLVIDNRCLQKKLFYFICWVLGSHNCLSFQVCLPQWHASILLSLVNAAGLSPKRVVHSSRDLQQELEVPCICRGLLGSWSWFGAWHKLISLCTVQEKKKGGVIVSWSSIIVSINRWVKLPVIVSFCAC